MCTYFDFDILTFWSHPEPSRWVQEVKIFNFFFVVLDLRIRVKSAGGKVVAKNSFFGLLLASWLLNWVILITQKFKTIGFHMSPTLEIFLGFGWGLVAFATLTEGFS